MPGFVLNALRMIFHIIVITLWLRGYYHAVSLILKMRQLRQRGRNMRLVLSLLKAMWVCQPAQIWDFLLDMLRRIKKEYQKEWNFQYSALSDAMSLCHTLKITLYVLSNRYPIVLVITQSCLTLCDPMNYSPPGSSLSMQFSRQEYWSG